MKCETYITGSYAECISHFVLVILIKMLPFSTDRETDFIFVKIILRNVYIVELSNSNAVYSKSTDGRTIVWPY